MREIEMDWMGPEDGITDKDTLTGLCVDYAIGGRYISVYGTNRGIELWLCCAWIPDADENTPRAAMTPEEIAHYKPLLRDLCKLRYNVVEEE